MWSWGTSLERGLDRVTCRGPCQPQPAWDSAARRYMYFSVLPWFFVADAVACCFPPLAEDDCILLSSSFCGKSLFPFYLLFCYGCRPFPNALQSDFGPGAGTYALENKGCPAFLKTCGNTCTLTVGL